LVCKNGHVLKGNLVARPDENLGFCTEKGCGAKIYGQCRNCGVRIRGAEYTNLGLAGRGPEPGYWLSAQDEDILPFCDACGDPQPWASRDEVLAQLRNLVEAQDLDKRDREKALAAVDRLRDSNLSERSELKLWRELIKHAPGILEAGKRIAESLLTAYLQRQLGL
jgi:hypothetical protein